MEGCQKFLTFASKSNTYLFAIDASNIIESSLVVLLNSFLKKETKQYKAEIDKAKMILKKLEDQTMINPEKLKGMKTAGQLFDEKYGNEGTESRREFNAKAQAWYYAELLKEERKKQKISQAQLANIIGKSRTYITALEKGQTDMQLSTFLMLSRALGLNFSLVVG